MGYRSGAPGYAWRCAGHAWDVQGGTGTNMHETEDLAEYPSEGDPAPWVRHSPVEQDEHRDDHERHMVWDYLVRARMSRLYF